MGGILWGKLMMGVSSMMESKGQGRMLSVREGIEDMMESYYAMQGMMESYYAMRGMMVFYFVIGLVSMMYLTVHPYFSIEHYTH